MIATELDALVTAVLSAAFALSALLGAVLRQTRFCAMGALSDVMHLGDWSRLRQWSMAAGVATLGFAALAASGQVDPARTLYATSSLAWLSALSGGLLFGFGMVLGSGCGSKNLVRLGGGSLKSLVVCVVMGLAAFATLKGITAVWRVATVDAVQWPLAGPAFLPDLWARLYGAPLPMSRLWLGLLAGCAMVAWALGRRAGRDPAALWGGAAVGAVVAAAWWLSGHWAEVQEHPLTLEHAFVATNSGRSEALSFVTPVAYTLDWLMFYSDRNKLLSTGIVSVLGVVAGAAAHALWTREFRWQGFADTEDLAHHLMGAVLMGVGGVTAMGCSIGQGLSALSTLHLASLISVPAIAAGALLALRYQAWRAERPLREPGAAR